MRSRTAKVITNAAANYARFLVSVVVFFLLTPLIIRHVGQRDFGLLTLTSSVLAFFSLLDMGLGTSVVRYVAECSGARDIDRRNRIVSTLAVLYLALSFIAALGIGAFSTVYADLLSVPDDQRSKALALLLILAARYVVLALPLGMFQGILFGEQRIFLINTVQIVVTLLYAAAAWAALSRGGGLITLAWINLAVMLIEYSAYAVFALRRVPGLRIAWSLADRTLLREITSFSAAQLIISSAAIVRMRTDPLIVSWVLPLSQVAVYAIALRVAENALLLTKQGINVLTPLIAQLKGEGDTQKVRFLLVSVGKFSFFSAVLLTVTISTFAREIIALWVGPEFAGAAPVLVVLMTAMCLLVPQMSAASVLMMTGHHKKMAKAEVAGMCINVGVSVALSRSLGLMGIAIGTLVATILVDLFYIVGAACRLQAVSYRSYARRVFLASALPGLVQWGVSYAIKRSLPPTSFPMLALETAPGLIAALIVFWVLFVEPSEKALLTSAIARPFPIAPAVAPSLRNTK